MTRNDFVHVFTSQCARMEGFFVTEETAKAQRIMWPTIAQKNANPINLRAWGSFPKEAGYAKFPGPPVTAWHNVTAASEQCVEGWKAAMRQCERNIFERPLTFVTFFAGERDDKGVVLPGGYPGFAPAADANKPLTYAQFVVSQLAIVLKRSDFTVNDRILDVFAKVG